MNTVFSPQLPTRQGDKLYWSGLYGAGLGLAITQAAEQYPGILVVITADHWQANRLENELRFFADNKLPILQFSDWETLPYDIFSPHEDIVSERLTTLAELPTLAQGVLIVPMSTLLQRLAPTNFLSSHSFILRKADRFNLQTMRQKLQQNGYRCVTEVMEHGEFAIRGSLIDIFPMGSSSPYRIDLFDDEVDSIRLFDVESQRSLETIAEIKLLPAREFPFDEAAIALFRNQWRDQFEANPRQCSVYQDVSQGVCSAGIEYYLPLFFDSTATLFDYLPENSQLICVGNLTTMTDYFWKEVMTRYEIRRHDVTRPILPPEKLYLSTQQLFEQMAKFPQVHFADELAATKKHVCHFGTVLPPSLPLDNRAVEPLQALKTFLITREQRVLFCAETIGRREALLKLLNTIDVSPVNCVSWQDFFTGTMAIGITVAALEQGLQLTQPAFALIAETQLFGQQVLQRRQRKQKNIDPDTIIRNLAELSVGAPVVHADHGVGRYLGLQRLTVSEIEAEFLTLEYAGGDKLYVPVASLHLISRYTGADTEHAPLHRLGTDHWEKAKRKAAEKVRDVAAELLELYAKRAGRPGMAFKAPDKEYFAFAAEFPFETTPDQQSAIDAVIDDMSQAKPMDRLVCGDVGFGKTEVAIRAAFLAVQSGKQVVLLVPTTLLAQQHYQNFCDRFANWPIRVEMLSRFRSAKEQTAIIENLQAGKIDILVGTHKVLQKSISFPQLGLVIIDEEHRFGVQQKDRLKALRAEVDILTLTATPIPRTLNMSLTGVRELSIIATPPAKRLSVKTFLHEREPGLIREAILREIMRGGQVYFLHNRVESIQRVARELSELVPEARIEVAHGQMMERELEKIMADFYHVRFNVLLCTTIIESGIDIPTANTIIIDRADLFGIAQLHQLRGRVGRSHHQAYAYLFIPSKELITPDAQKRLDVISSMEDLGAGFTLATHDLEIRGAGELLGEEQSGQMHEIGFSLYMELLDRAIKSLQQGKIFNVDEPLRANVEVNLQISALIPDDYLPDVHGRLMLYKRIASCRTGDELQSLQIEMIDRFGLLTPQINYLFATAEIKLCCEKLGIRKIEANAQGMVLFFEKNPQVNSKVIVNLIQQSSRQYKLEGPQRLRCILPLSNPEERIKAVNDLLTKLG